MGLIKWLPAVALPPAAGGSRQGRKEENNMLFMNTFLSYLLVVIVFVVVAGIGVTLGIIMRKRKNSQAGEEGTETSRAEE